MGEFPPGIAYIDGEFVPISEAKISVLDWGLLRSDATYDVVHVWKSRFFRLDHHLDRFMASVEKLRMKLPFDRDGLEQILHQCVARSGMEDAYVEMVLTRGVSPTFSRDHAMRSTISSSLLSPLAGLPMRSNVHAAFVCTSPQ